MKLWKADGTEKRSFALTDDAAEGTSRIRVLPTRVAVSFDGKTVMAGDSVGRLHAWQVD